MNTLDRDRYSPSKFFIYFLFIFIVDYDLFGCLISVISKRGCLFRLAVHSRHFYKMRFNRNESIFRCCFFIFLWIKKIGIFWVWLCYIYKHIMTYAYKSFIRFRNSNSNNKFKLFKLITLSRFSFTYIILKFSN